MADSCESLCKPFCSGQRVNINDDKCQETALMTVHQTDASMHSLPPLVQLCQAQYRPLTLSKVLHWIGLQ